LITMTVIIAVGGEPGTSTEYFDLLNNNTIKALLRMDFASVLNLTCYYFIFFGIFIALRKVSEAYVTIATIFAFIGITLWFASHSAFSMISLSKQYSNAISELEKSSLLAAGEAIISSDMWHSTGAILGAIFLESAAVFFSILMLKSKVFGKPTALIGIITHSFDLAHVIIGIFSINIGNTLMMVAGPLYLIWLPLVGIKLIKYSKRELNE
jgi:hypothetical protein